MNGVRPSLWPAFLLAACLLEPACKRVPLRTGTGGVDAGAVETGVMETGGADASVVDGGGADAGVVDSGGVDAGSPASAACVANPAAPSLAFVGIPIDFDEDGVADTVDDCPAQKNPTQADGDRDGLGDACDMCPGGTDADRDGVCDGADNCPNLWNPAQSDIDNDRVGDACDTQSCNSPASAAEAQRYLAMLLGHPDFAAPIAGDRWRMAAAQTYCATGNGRGVLITIYDYDARRSIAASLQIDTDTLASLRMTAFDAGGPQANAPEGFEATALARADAAVQQRAASLGPLDASVFFFEFPNDARFAACATGRCLDVLFEMRVGGSSQIVFTAVVDLRTCRVLGVVDRGP